MATLKITKKHHKHLNNPFPSPPRTLPLIRGGLYFNPQTVPPNQLFYIGTDFQLLWSSVNGGYISVSHNSQPARAIWSTVPGQAFVSAAATETEVEESRGSFSIKDRNIHFVCNHQTIEHIRLIDQYDGWFSEANDHDLRESLKVTHYPILLIKGSIFNARRKMRGFLKSEIQDKGVYIDGKLPYIYGKYWVLFYQKNSHQIGFQVNVGKPSSEFLNLSASRSYLGKRLGRFWPLWWMRRGFEAASAVEDEREEGEVAKAAEFNRVCLNYLSEGDERFYGFGEQFSHMDFKGKRVPIFVQEQGIGRGDQPITLAVNLISYRAGGDWSTTYAPSPFYMTSKMRSLYLEGYSYTIFDLTRQDRVQIQVHGTSVRGAILHGQSPTDLIETFTETIGRPPELPHWIISGAVVGMQGGTDTVRQMWDILRTYDVPISAFWLQGNRPSCNSQFYSNDNTLSHFARFAKVYEAWKFYRIQLVKEAAQKGLPICRHLVLHYPEDEYVHKLTYQQFLVGTDILVVPVLDNGRRHVKAYFPIGESCSWKHIWTGKLYSKQGYEAWVEAPIGRPAIFVKYESSLRVEEERRK